MYNYPHGYIPDYEEVNNIVSDWFKIIKSKYNKNYSNFYPILDSVEVYIIEVDKIVWKRNTHKLWIQFCYWWNVISSREVLQQLCMMIREWILRLTPKRLWPAESNKTFHIFVIKDRHNFIIDRELISKRSKNFAW